MLTYSATALLVAALSAMPVSGLAATQTKTKTPAATKTASTPATHSTSGVVKSIDDSTLVIAGKSKSHPEMTFTLNSSTHREGTIAVGTTVSVRYHEEGKTHIATAVQAQPSKHQSGHTKN